MVYYRIKLCPETDLNVRPEWAYRLYAALLAMGTEQFGDMVHRDGITPISQHLERDRNGLVWCVSLFGQQAADTLGEVLERHNRFYLKKGNIVLAVTDRIRQPIPDIEQLLQLGEGYSGRHRLDFQTPAAFKTGGRYCCIPNQRLILQNLFKQWNGCFPECPIEDEDGEGIDSMAQGLECSGFQLRSQTYYLKGNSIPGFTGWMTMENRLTGFHRQLADALLIFSGYTGIGIKTTLGMGGVQHRLL